VKWLMMVVPFLFGCVATSGELRALADQLDAAQAAAEAASQAASAAVSSGVSPVEGVAGALLTGAAVWLGRNATRKKALAKAVEPGD